MSLLRQTGKMKDVKHLRNDLFNLNNSYLPSPKITEKQLEELRKCARDPIYFLKNYAYIKHPLRGTIPFALYPKQEKLVNDFIKNRQIIINKSRQIGISTTIAGYITWMFWFHKDQEILVIATKKKVAANLIKKVKTIIRHIPKWMKAMSIVTVDNVFSIELSNGSRVEAIAKTADAGRSEGLSLLVIDEMAHIEEIENLWVSAKPTISTGGAVICCSTPNGAFGLFHDLCKEAMITEKDGEPGKNGMVYVELPWQIVIEHDETWFKNETKGMSQKKIRQEFLCSFLGSGDTVLEPETLEKISKEIEENKFFIKDGTYPLLTIYREYNSKAVYLITGDTSRGDAGDYTGIQVWEILSRDEIYEAAVIKDKITYDKVVEISLYLYKMYHEPLIAFESNYLGVVVMGELYKKGCERIYYSLLKKDVDEYNKDESKEEQLKKVPGFTTSRKTRDIAISIWERMVRENKCHIFSKLTLDECTTFIWKRSPISVRAEAQSGAHDDLILSSVIACYIVNTEYDKLLADINDLTKFYENIKLEKINVNDYLTSEETKNELDQKEKNKRLLEKLEGQFSNTSQAFSYNNEQNPNKKLIEQFKAQKTLRELFPELFS